MLDGLQAEAIAHVGADVGELPDLGLPSFDRDAGMELPGHREDPPLVGMLLLKALARDGHSIGVRQLAIPAHGKLAAAGLSGLDLIVKGLGCVLVARIGPQGKLDEPKPRLPLALQLRDLQVLEGHVPDLKGTGLRSTLCRELVLLLFLIAAGVQAGIIGRRCDPTPGVGVIPEVADREQAGESVRHLHFRLAVRVRVEPIHSARMVAGDDVAVVDVAILTARDARSGIQRAGISGRIRGSRCRTAVRVARRPAAGSGSRHEDAIAVDAVVAFDADPLG